MYLCHINSMALTISSVNKSNNFYSYVLSLKHLKIFLNKSIKIESLILTNYRVNIKLWQKEIQ